MYQEEFKKWLEEEKIDFENEPLFLLGVIESVLKQNCEPDYKVKEIQRYIDAFHKVRSSENRMEGYVKESIRAWFNSSGEEEEGCINSIQSLMDLEQETSYLKSSFSEICKFMHDTQEEKIQKIYEFLQQLQKDNMLSRITSKLEDLSEEYSTDYKLLDFNWDGGSEGHFYCEDISFLSADQYDTIANRLDAISGEVRKLIKDGVIKTHEELWIELY